MAHRFYHYGFPLNDSPSCRRINCASLADKSRMTFASDQLPLVLTKNTSFLFPDAVSGSGEDPFLLAYDVGLNASHRPRQSSKHVPYGSRAPVP